MKIGALNCMIAACAISAAAAPAWADCEQELAQFQEQHQSGAEGGGISKDGSLAPLEETDSTSTETTPNKAEGTDQAGAASGEGEVVKDGSNTPLETDLSGVATSGQEAAAQQDEASAEAGSAMSEDAQEALDRAEAALQAGDETGCMDALEQARNL